MEFQKYTWSGIVVFLFIYELKSFFRLNDGKFHRVYFHIHTYKIIFEYVEGCL